LMLEVVPELSVDQDSPRHEFVEPYMTKFCDFSRHRGVCEPFREDTDFDSSSGSDGIGADVVMNNFDLGVKTPMALTSSKEFSEFDFAAISAFLSSVRQPAEIGAVDDGTSTCAGTEVDHVYEGHLQRRGVRWWDVIWNDMTVVLDGARLCIYDEEIDGCGHVLHSCANLRGRFEIVVSPDCARRWRVRPTLGGSDMFKFEWQAPDSHAAQEWIERLRAACSYPEWPFTVCTPALEEGQDLALRKMLAAFPPPPS